MGGPGCCGLIVAAAILGAILQTCGVVSDGGGGGGGGGDDDPGQSWDADQCEFTRGLLEGPDREYAFSQEELENMQDNYDAYCR